VTQAAPGTAKAFDRCFRPASGRVRSRWERLALAQRRGEAIPPIEVYRVGHRHFVSPVLDEKQSACRPGQRVWLPAVAKAGLPGIHFHDLRHAGNTLTADAGASLRELMDRVGHSSTRAALIYQHSSDEWQRKLADAIGEAARAVLLKTATPSGTHVARETSGQP
jgi:integrase